MIEPESGLALEYNSGILCCVFYAQATLKIPLQAQSRLPYPPVSV